MGKSSYRVGIGKKAFLTKMLSYPQLYNYSRDQITSFNVISKKASNWPKQSSLVRYIYLHYNLLAFDFPPIPQKDETRILVKRRCSSFTQMNNQKDMLSLKLWPSPFFAAKIHINQAIFSLSILLWHCVPGMLYSVACPKKYCKLSVLK